MNKSSPNSYFYSMKTALLSILCTTIITFISCSQEKKYDCEDILGQQLYSAAIRKEYDEDSLKRDYEILIQCGDMDSVDATIFNGPMLGIILMDQARDEENFEELTYRACIELIADFKKEHKNDYSMLYRGTAARMEIQHIKVDLAKFESMRPKLISSGFKAEEIDDLKEFLQINQNDWTYKEAVIAFADWQEEKEVSNEPLIFPELPDYHNALMEAKKENKNLLIYFTGWACVNARKFEDMLLRDQATKDKISTNYVYYSAYVDDKRAHAGGKGTKGEINMSLQMNVFKSSGQPSLYIVSPDGTIIANWTFDKGINAFDSFLQQGM
jgi:hypothetical protein